MSRIAYPYGTDEFGHAIFMRRKMRSNPNDTTFQLMYVPSRVATDSTRFDVANTVARRFVVLLVSCICLYGYNYFERKISSLFKSS